MTDKYMIIGAGGRQIVTSLEAALNVFRIRLGMGMVNVALIPHGSEQHAKNVERALKREIEEVAQWPLK